MLKYKLKCFKDLSDIEDIFKENFYNTDYSIAFFDNITCKSEFLNRLNKYINCLFNIKEGFIYLDLENKELIEKLKDFGFETTSETINLTKRFFIVEYKEIEIMKYKTIRGLSNELWR